jgi:AcrR family transcriptional regulator
MTGDERRSAIVKSVLPLFAKRGFASTTSRELAEVAGVSEALIYNHFPSKESLYAEIQSFGCQGAEVALERIAGLEPSSRTLVLIVYFMMRCLSLGRVNDPIGWNTRHRLVLNSCLEDGSYPRYLFNQHFSGCLAKLEASMDASAAAGDLVDYPATRRNRCLFGHHLACMIAVMHLPERPVIDYATPREGLLDQAVQFSLRGMGLSDAAIQRHYQPAEFAEFLGLETGQEKEANPG